MKRIIRTLLPLLMLTGFYSCTSLLPVNSHFENAATLKKDNVEVSGSYSKYYQEGFGRTEKTNDQYGLRVGIGLSNQFDLKFQYDHLVFSPNFDHSLFRANYIGLIPKIAILPEHLSFMMPVGLYYLKNKNDYTDSHSQVTSIAPMLLLSFAPVKNKVDFTVSGKFELLSGYDGSNIFFGSSLGAGFSSNLNKWAIRPEIGISTDGGDYKFKNFGIAFQYRFHVRRK